MKKRIVFDLDGTLINGNYQCICDYFMNKFGEEAISFLEFMPNLLDEYEKNFSRYQYDTLSRFLRFKTGLAIEPSIVHEWNQLLSEIPNIEEPYAKDTLEYLKNREKSIIVLTNWFGDSQKERLRRSGLLPYIDSVYGGDIWTKPHREAYLHAIDSYNPEECVFIGDNVEMDYVGPRACAIDSILYDRHDQHHKSIVKVKNLNELKKKKIGGYYE